MTKEQLEKANKIKEELDKIGEVIQICPCNDSYGCEWRILLGDHQALADLIIKYSDRFLPIFLNIKNELDQELDEL